ncbi:MAG TPA: SDR family NAD(P)-dependent oxidoreductase [Acidimicrobiales bacterium]
MGVFDGKVAIVTGAGRGMGRAEAMMLAAQGARVVVNDLGGSLEGRGADGSPAHEVVEEIRSSGGSADANTDDVSTWEGARGLVQQAIDTYGGLDVVVNNAGVIRTGMSFNLDESDWDTVIAVHLKGTFGTCRFAGAYWRDRSKSTGRPGDAAIVNTSSPNGLNGGSPGHVNYAVAKSGIATMTVTLARELAPYGVRCNAIAPVAFTRMTESLWGDGIFVDANREELGPEGVATVVGWLASPLAEGISGQVLAVSGHTLSVWEGWRVAAHFDGRDGDWTIEQLARSRHEVFDERDPGVPGAG